MQIIKHIPIETILFMDIETAPQWLKFKDVPENVRIEWLYKFKFRPEAPKEPRLDEDNPNSNANYERFLENYEKYFSDLWDTSAGLYPEFSRVICVSVGFMFDGLFYMRTFSDENEGDLLRGFKNGLDGFCKNVPNAKMCAHYGKGFDYPFVGKRMIVNRIPLPFLLDTSHLKPWEIPNLDTQEIWKFGSGGSAGLPAICMALGIPTPKQDLEGSKVAAAYHNGEIDRICVYCEKDVFALVNVFRAMRLEELLDESQISMQE